MKYFFRRRHVVVMSALVGISLAAAVSAYAATTIGTDISTGGTLSVTGHSGIGSAAEIDTQPFSPFDSSSNTDILNLRETNTDNSTDYHGGLFVGENLNPIGALNGDYHDEYGIESQITTDPTDTQNHGDLYGIESIIANSGTGSVDNTWGFSGGRQIIGGPVGASYGLDLFLSPVAQTLDSNYGINIETPNVTSGSIGTNYGISIQDQQVGTNNYAIWYDGPGNVVWRVKADGVVADYNPLFSPKYTPGATDFERVVTQWNSDVAEIGTEAGGTGTLRPLRLLGSSVDATAYKVGGVSGLNRVLNLKGSDGNNCSETVTNGIITASTCP